LLTLLCRFGWAACQLDILRRSVPEGISKALDELPAALYERYMRALEKIPDGKQERAHYLFQCLVASIRPLLTEELEEILAIRFDRVAPPKEKEDRRQRDSETASFSACSSLVDIVEAEDSQLTQFSHFSVKQFLTSTRLTEDEHLSHYHIPPEPAHATLAEACLTVLVQDKVDDQRSPLALYAAQHWFLHARFGNVAIQPEVQSLMKDLFDRNRPHLRGWIRIHDIDQRGEQAAARHRTVWQDTGSPLYYAVLCGLPSLVNDLINAGSHNMNEKGGTHGTALHAALQNKDLKIADLLLEHGADVDAKDKFHSRPLEKVLNDNHIEALRLLLKRRANLNALDKCGWTPLRRASANGQLEVVRLLLQNGAQVNAADALGWTPLHLASINGHADVTRLLLENAANMNAQTKGDFTPLYVASSRGFIDVVRVLLRHGADVRLRGTGNQSPLRAALTQKHDKVAKLVAGNLEGW
jgi:ankyrin repeat protein